MVVADSIVVVLVQVAVLHNVLDAQVVKVDVQVAQDAQVVVMDLAQDDAIQDVQHVRAVVAETAQVVLVVLDLVLVPVQVVDQVVMVDVVQAVTIHVIILVLIIVKMVVQVVLDVQQLVLVIVSQLIHCKVGKMKIDITVDDKNSIEQYNAEYLNNLYLLIYCFKHGFNVNDYMKECIISHIRRDLYITGIIGNYRNFKVNFEDNNIEVFE